MTWLATDDVRRLTGRTRFTAMRRVLARMGIKYTLTAAGEPLVRADALDGGARVARNPRVRFDVGR